MARSTEQDWAEMSDRLKGELCASVKAGDELFAPSPDVSSEAVRFIRPGGRSFLYLRLAHGVRPGFDGDGRMVGIKIGEELASLALCSR